VIRAYRSDRGQAQGKAGITDVLRRLKAGEAQKPPAYPEAPIRITVGGDAKSLIANEVQIYELSVGVTSFNLYIFGQQEDDLGWLIGKTLYLEAAPASSRCPD
jgi:hypothetical protein